jgi:hypothetical protein
MLELLWRQRTFRHKKNVISHGLNPAVVAFSQQREITPHERNAQVRGAVALQNPPSWILWTGWEP